MGITKTITVEIERCQPEEGAGQFARYDVECDTPVTVLGILKHIHRIDSSLAFRWSCGAGKCGACGVTVNNKPVLACCEPVKEETLRIKPLKNFPVLRDLIIDRQPYYELREKAENSCAGYDPAAVIDQELLAGCVECLCCMSVCPALWKRQGDFAGPAVIVARLRHGLPVSGEGCIGCGRCTEACSQGIDVVGLLNKIK